MRKEPCGSYRNLQPDVTGNTGENIMLGDEKGTVLSRYIAKKVSFFKLILKLSKRFSVQRWTWLCILTDSFLRFPWNGPEHKRPPLPCNFFLQGNSCRFLHVKENTNHTRQQHMAATSGIQSVEGM